MPSAKMFTARKKIAKEKGAEPDEFEESVAQVRCRRDVHMGRPFWSVASALRAVASAAAAAAGKATQPASQQRICSCWGTVSERPMVKLMSAGQALGVPICSEALVL